MPGKDMLGLLGATGLPVLRPASLPRLQWKLELEEGTRRDTEPPLLEPPE